MRELTPEECEFIAGGNYTGVSEYPPEIVVVASPPPYHPPYYPPYEPPYNPGTGYPPGYGGGGGGGGGVPTIGETGSGADIWLKPGADISNLSNEMKAALDEVVDIAEALGLPQVVITAGRNGAHSTDSLHYGGNALDFRGNTMSVAQGEAWANALRSALGSNYDVLFETSSGNPANNHLHIEYDPD